ncbi:MAG: formate/nitrite transporter family protein [Clostridia bacterium]|nr:formate/nitrite transporter family protein [Clostridia bacterium]
MLKTVTDSVSAGILIAVGGSVFLACDNKYIGAVLFSVALLCICYLGYYLFTGKIGYLAHNHSKKNISALAIGLFVNLIITFLLGIIIRFALPALSENALAMCTVKLQQTFIVTFIRGIFCGILMYLAVQIFKEKKTPVGILFCIPVFILSGFEHSVADMFYFGMSGIFSVNILSFELAAVIGNSVGSLILPILSKVGDKHAKD